MPVLKGESMKCITPMYRLFNIGDEANARIISRAEARQILEAEPNATRLLRKGNYLSSRKIQPIPCGHCWACQLNYSAEWATRIMLEAQKYECNWFITLTYDDEHLPILQRIETEEKIEDQNGIVEITDVIYENDGTWKGSLYPEHMKTFLNSLRKYFERKKITGIKYYYCGEYGEESRILKNGKHTEGFRPHYHIILLNCPLNINDFYNTHIDTNFKAHWKSKEIERFWTRGIVDISELEWSAAAYVARYCTKKINFDIDKRTYYKIGKLPEYVRMSKGIGFDYYEKHKEEIYKNDEMIMKTIKGNTGSFKPPRAFDKKLRDQDPKAYKLIKESRKHIAERSANYQKEITDYTDLELSNIKADRLLTKMQMLPRVGEW